MRSRNRIGILKGHTPPDSPSSSSPSIFSSYGSFEGSSSTTATTTATTANATMRTTSNVMSYSSRTVIVNTTTTTTTSSSSSSSRIGTITPGHYRECRMKQSSSRSPASPGASLKQWMIDTLRVMIQYISVSLKKIKPDYSLGGGAADSEWAQPDVLVDAATRQMLDRYREFVCIPFDTEDQCHERLLMHLWHVCMGDRMALNARVSSSWRHVGFQGRDPASDFRATGVFGLRCVLYHAEQYPQQFRDQFARNCSTAEGHSYPFAIAGLNCVMLLFDILGYGITSKQTTNFAAKKRLFELLMTYGGPFMQTHAFEKRLHERGHVVYHQSGVSAVTSTLLSHENTSSRSSNHGTSKKKKKLTIQEVDILDFGYDSPTDTATVATDSCGSERAEAETEMEMDAPVKKRKSKKSRSNRRICPNGGGTGSSEPLRVNVVFEELFVCAFRILDSEWHRVSASYMNFPQIFKTTKDRVEELLESRFFTVEDVIKFNKRGSV